MARKSKRVTRVPWDIPAWFRGVLHLSPEQRGVYHDLCLLIYQEGGPLPFEANAAGVARACGCNGRKLRRITNELVAAGKLFWTADGRLTNERCEAEIAEVIRLSEHRRDASQAGVQARGRATGTDGASAGELPINSQFSGPVSSEINDIAEPSGPATARSGSNRPELPINSQSFGPSSGENNDLAEPLGPGKRPSGETAKELPINSQNFGPVSGENNDLAEPRARGAPARVDNTNLTSLTSLDNKPYTPTEGGAGGRCDSPPVADPAPSDPTADPAAADQPALLQTQQTDPAERARAIWDECVPGYMRCKRMAAPTAAKLRRRLVEDFGRSPGRWRQFCQTVAASDFLTGRTEQNFRADLAWCLEPRNIEKICNGRYSQERTAGPGSPTVVQNQSAWGRDFDAYRAWVREWRECRASHRPLPEAPLSPERITEIENYLARLRAQRTDQGGQ